MERTSILFINSTPEHGGANIQLIEIVKRLDLEEYRPIFVNPPQNVVREAEFGQFNSPVITMRLGVIKRSYNPLKAINFLLETVWGVIKLSGLIKRENIQLVHVNTAPVISGALAAKLAGVPVIWHIHEVFTPKAIKLFLCPVILALSNQVVAISETVRAQFPIKSRSQIQVVYDGIDLEKLKPKTEEEQNKTRKYFNVPRNVPLIGMVGRFVPWKGQECFIKACAQVALDFPEAHFILAGQTFSELEQYTKKLEILVGKLNLGNRLQFSYWCEDSAELISTLDLFVHASVRPEPFGLVVIEAMALGKPTIGTIGGVREIITKDVGITVPANNPLAMSNAIKHILNNKKLAKSMGKKGRPRVARFFNSEFTAKNFTAIYQILLNNRSTALKKGRTR